MSTSKKQQLSVWKINVGDKKIYKHDHYNHNYHFITCKYFNLSTKKLNYTRLAAHIFFLLSFRRLYKQMQIKNYPKLPDFHFKRSFTEIF